MLVDRSQASSPEAEAGRPSVLRDDLTAAQLAEDAWRERAMANGEVGRDEVAMMSLGVGRREHFRLSLLGGCG